MRTLAAMILCASLAAVPAVSEADDLEDALRELVSQEIERPDYRVAQRGGGKSLSEAVEQVRRQTNGRIISAETRVQGGREVHHIKVLTKDGKVKTHKVQGKKRG